MADDYYLAFDLGASNIRVILGRLDEGHLEIIPLHSVPNEIVNIGGSLHWNVLGIYCEMLQGMALCAAEYTRSPVSIGVDTWGIDFGLLDAWGNLIGAPYSYRDRRTRGAMEEVFQIMPRSRLHKLTGLEFRPIHTIFQLYSMVRDKNPQLEIATDLLFMPDIFNYFLTGNKKSEFTEATTSQLYNPRTGQWEQEIFDRLGLPEGLMQEVVPSEAVIGRLAENISAQTGLEVVPVVAGASHDTAAAVAAVPALGDNFAFLSSGTWSLMGIESKVPVINEKSLQYSIANQGNVCQTYMVLKNITGLWLLEECRRAWSKTREYSTGELVEMAENAGSLGTVVDPDHPDFLAPESMPKAIARFCRNTDQPVPTDIGQYVRVILESLALTYRHTLEILEDLVGSKIERIHIVGGGSNNALLNQLTADATVIPVYAGPAEATSIGNILVQALAMGRIASLDELREIVKNSFEVTRFEPRPNPCWDRTYQKLVQIRN